MRGWGRLGSRGTRPGFGQSPGPLVVSEGEYEPEDVPDPRSSGLPLSAGLDRVGADRPEPRHRGIAVGDPRRSVTTIEIKMEGKKMGFFGPTTVHEGEVLRIVNTTKPSMVGPHTFSLVTKGSLPKTAKQRQTCFTPGHLHGIAEWHHFNREKTEKAVWSKRDRRLEHEGTAEKEWRLLVLRKNRRLDRTEGDRQSRDHALLHVRGPRLDAGLDQGAAGCRT